MQLFAGTRSRSWEYLSPLALFFPNPIAYQGVQDAPARQPSPKSAARFPQEPGRHPFRSALRKCQTQLSTAAQPWFVSEMETVLSPASPPGGGLSWSHAPGDDRKRKRTIPCLPAYPYAPLASGFLSQFAGGIFFAPQAAGSAWSLKVLSGRPVLPEICRSAAPVLPRHFWANEREGLSV